MLYVRVYLQIHKHITLGSHKYSYHNRTLCSTLALLEGVIGAAVVRCIAILLMLLQQCPPPTPQSPGQCRGRGMARMCVIRISLLRVAQGLLPRGFPLLLRRPPALDVALFLNDGGVLGVGRAQHRAEAVEYTEYAL